ncbi:MAG: hypothetical protein J6X25_09325 [Bacteroidales bacterium]|nr:hypothetical protein [Bacteroidales bacterium]
MADIFDESVSLLSRLRNLENFYYTGIGNSFITLFGVPCPLAQSQYGCGVLFICVKVFQNPEADKRESLHTFVLLNGHVGAVPHNQNPMKAEIRETYATPKVEVVVIITETNFAGTQTEPIHDDPTEHEW